MNDAFDRLLADHLADGGHQRHDELDRLVAEDPEAARNLVEEARLHRLLAAELGPITLAERVQADIQRLGRTAPDGAAAPRPPSQPLRLRRTRPAPRRGGRWALVLVAASLLILVMAGLQLQRPAPRTVVLASGGAGVVANAIPIPAGGAIPPGALIAVDAAAPPARLAYADGSTATMAPGTRARLLAADGGDRLELVTGSVDAVVAARGDRQPFRIATPAATVSVVGTEFTVRAGDDTYVGVRKGRVMVETPRLATPVLLAVGEWLSVGAAGAPILSRQAIWPPPGGLRTFAKTGTASEHALRSQRFVPPADNPFFTPDQMICLQDGRPGPPALVRLEAGWWLQLRLRAERPGRAMVTLAAHAGSSGKPGNYGSREFRVGPDEQTVVLTGATFHDDKGGPGPPALWPVETICLWGFAAGELALADLSIGTAGGSMTQAP